MKFSIFLSLILVSPAWGTMFDVTFQAKHKNIPVEWTGVVDSETDTLTITEWFSPEVCFTVGWNEICQKIQQPKPSTVFDALTNGEWKHIDGNPYMPQILEVIPYDIPDDWNGRLEDWAFISPSMGSIDYTIEHAGIGGNRRMDCEDGGITGIRNKWYLPNWYIIEYQDDMPNGQDSITINPTLIDVTPAINRTVGDSTLDGSFNSDDLVHVLSTGKYHTGEPALWAEGDWNQDDFFDSGDMVAAFTAGRYEAAAAAHAVPEPRTILIVLIGVSVLLLIRKC